MLNIDDIIHLTEADWLFEAPKGKSQAALTGLALDGHIKRLVEANGCTASQERFGPWDWALPDGTLVDTKSYTKKSITVSDRELDFTYKHLANGGSMLHAIFEQLDSNTCLFRGFINVQVLIDKNKIYPSKDYGGYYYSMNNVSGLLF